MSAAPIKPTEIVCKDGRRFLVTGRPGSVVVFATFRDPARVQCGLAKFETFHEPGDLRAEHQGMPVEIVRAYAKLHGGVAEAGPEALALLKSLPSAADPAKGEPATDSQPPAAKEATPENPLPHALGASLAGRAESQTAPRADSQHAFEAARLVLDELTQAVIEARRAVADFEGPVRWKKEWGKHRADLLPEVAALWERITCGSGLASRLIVVTQPRYGTHPLLAEGTALRAQLQRIADEARRERDARREADTAAWSARNEARRRATG